MPLSNSSHHANKIHKIAYLNAVRAFEATARHSSFAAAAQELNVTSAAVGQQVRQLEDWLAVRLFHRSTSGSNRLTLTEQGQRAFPDIQRGLDLILRGLNQVFEQAQEMQIMVSASPSISAKWLIPLVNSYQARHGETIRVETDLALVNYLEQGIDIGVRYGAGQWSGMHAQHLMAEDIFPVCSPAFAQQYSLTEISTEVLAGVPLIHDCSAPQGSGYPSWQAWANAFAINLPDALGGVQVNDFSSVLALVCNGHGLALGRSRLIEEELASGTLICPFDESVSKLRSPFAYYLVWPEQAKANARVDAFRHWLSAQ